MDNIDVINFLTGSQARWQILQALHEQPREFGQLRRDLEIPQSTLNRNLTKLTEDGWVHEHTDRTYRLTSLGGFLVSRMQPLAGVLAVAGELADYPDALPLETFDFDADRLAEAEWRTAGKNEPYTIINRVRALFAEGREVLGVTPHYNPAYIDVSDRVAKKEGGRVVGIVPDHQLEAAIEDEHFDLSQFRNVSSVEFRIWEGDIDYSVAIIDDETVVVTGDHAGGMPSVMFESQDDAILGWARETYERIYERSREVG